MAALSEEDRRRYLMMALARQGIMMPQPQPLEASPASPLPMVPVEAPVVAPQSVQAVAPQPFDELAPVRAAIANRPAPASTGNAAVDKALAQAQATQSAGIQNLMALMSQAQMSPEEKAILEARRARTQQQMEKLAEDEKRSKWDALAQAGFAMAKSSSPFFMQALASGMEAGMGELNRSKAAREDKRSRLELADEEAQLSAIRGRQAAQDRAIAIYNAAIAAGKSETEAMRDARKAAEEVATTPQRMELADLEVAGKRADLALTRARTVDALRAPSGGGGGGGGGGSGGGAKPLPPGARAEAEGRLTTAYSEQDEAYREWVAAGKPTLGRVKQGTPEWDAASKYAAARGKVNNLRRILGQPSLGELKPSARPWTSRQENALSKSKPAAPARAPARPAGVGADWTLQQDAKGRKAWVSPDGKRYKEVS
jgi:hypothetical protein